MANGQSLKQRMTLAAAAVGFVVVLLDVSVVNVALGAMRLQFQTDVADLQWIVNAYTLVFAALLLTSGALGDRLGARWIFAAGFLVFTLASVACGLAGSFPLLLAARIVQGLGAALLVPNSLALLQQAFPDKRQRTHAVSLWGAAGGIALAAGPIAGGFLVDHFGWPSIFLINLPIGAVGLALTLINFEPGSRNGARSLDLPGQALAILALASLALALSDVARFGWGHPRVLTEFAAAIVLAVAFIVTEKISRAPMLPLSLFAIPAFAIASLSGLIVNFAYYGLVFVFSLFFQLQQHLSPEQTGIAFLPMTVVLMAANMVAGRLIHRVGARSLMIAGLLISATGYGLLIPIDAGSAFRDLAIPMLIAAGGIALLVPTMTNLTLSSVDASKGGIASGILNTFRQVGGMIGVATSGYLVRDTAPAAFMAGMHTAIILSVALLLLTAAITAIGLGREDVVAGPAVD